MTCDRALQKKLWKICGELRDTAENISPEGGVSNGLAHPAPALREWADRLTSIADELTAT